jgi:hypothetical protein
VIEILERGDIRFFYRPKVQPADLDAPFEPGVQAFFAVLSPAGSRAHRRVRIGRKRMPIPKVDRHRFWCRVERVGSLDRVLAGQVEDERYTTKTRGERYQPGARPIAYGCYAFVRHDDHTHLVYRLEGTEPDAPDEVRPPDAASNVILFERTDPKSKAIWTTEGDPRRLDQEGEELVLVGVDDDPERELGIDLLAS